MKITTTAADLWAWRYQNAWIEHWLAEHEAKLPDMSRWQRRRARWQIAKEAWDEMRKLQKKEERRIVQ